MGTEIKAHCAWVPQDQFLQDYWGVEGQESDNVGAAKALEERDGLKLSSRQISHVKERVQREHYVCITAMISLSRNSMLSCKGFISLSELNLMCLLLTLFQSTVSLKYASGHLVQQSEFTSLPRPGIAEQDDVTGSIARPMQ